METKFTNGKWSVGICELVFSGDNIVADAGCSLRFQKEREANAHLIAAAPEMYEMLEKLRDYLREFLSDEDSIDTEFYHMIEKLLAKARGEAKE